MNEKQKKTTEPDNRKNRLWLVLFLMLLTAGALAIPLFVHTDKGLLKDDNPAPLPQPLPPVELSFTCVGDIMAHSTQLSAQYDKSGDTYDFTNNYLYVRDYISRADVALCNVETTFAGGKPSGYPAFNSPDSMADALKEAGFDVAITANNHMMDRGFDGMQRTLEVLRGAGLLTVGSRKQGEPSWALLDVKGVKVGVVAYTYETTGVNAKRTINGMALSEESKALINSFSYSMLTEDLTQIKEDIDEVRAQGAQIVIAYLHWGEEYQRTPNDWQQLIAARVAGYGADVIFASHPHVLQPVGYLYVTPQGEVSYEESAGSEQENGEEVLLRKVPVFYSMGNFISNQRSETLNNRYTEQGMLAGVILSWDQEAQKIREISMEVLPTWVERYYADGKQNYYIIPLDNAMNSNETLTLSGHLDRARQALWDVRELIGDEYMSPSCPPAQGEEP